jgi:hypothetical protein
MISCGEKPMSAKISTSMETPASVAAIRRIPPPSDLSNDDVRRYLETFVREDAAGTSSASDREYGDFIFHKRHQNASISQKIALN